MPLNKLKEISEILRSENGCPWDKEQTPETLKKYLIEEAYEVIDAIENNDYAGYKEELGDLLYQIYAHSQIAEEQKKFTVDDVAQAIIDKLIRRHPHVFGNTSVKDSAEVLDKWEKIKKTEKSPDKSSLDGIPKHLPALLKAYRIQEKASHQGFDWQTIDGPMEKLKEETDELIAAVNSNDQSSAMEEIGDVLFSIVNICRFIKIDPEEALQKSNNKFMNRFKYIENELRTINKHIHDMSAEELDILWNKSKAL